uniref:Uncharacterized protein n=1 Tax=Zonotrichia albicollis TaxID=44394 RepID=A0A8D2MA33_ZONAL
IIRNVKIRAHLCPFLSRGIIRCFVTRLINHSWRAEGQLVIYQLSRDGSRRAGNVVEMRISGIPRKDGLENWSEKLKFMVRFRGLCLSGLLEGGFIDMND